MENPCEGQEKGGPSQVEEVCTHHGTRCGDLWGDETAE
jgi:hypothetical protein